MMEKLKGASYNPYSLAVEFCYALCKELDYHRNSRKYLTIDEYKVLKEYYPALSLKTVKYFATCEVPMLTYLIDYIANYPCSPRILDAGCGLGSHAIFFGLLGAEVEGVDLSKERLNIANKRLQYYSDKYGKTLNVRFSFKNILTFCERIGFDMVWSNQSISHIHPVQKFLRMAIKNLRNGGSLLICDSNGINPWIAFLTMLVHHKGGVYTTAKDPDTCEQIPYARERMLNPLILSNLLRERL